MKAKYFLLVGFIFTIISFIIYIILFYFQLKAPLEAEYWVGDIIQYKDSKARSIKSKKIIIISGSNSLFGINSKLIQEKTGYPVVNLATHASLDIDFLYHKIKEHIKKGDIIVMPLEFEHYSREGIISNWFSNNIMSWSTSYLNQLRLIDLAQFIITTEPIRVFKGVIKQIKSNSTNDKLISQKTILKNLNNLWSEQGENWRGYSYKSLNQFGDINVNLPTACKSNLPYIDNKIQISPYFLEKFRKIKKLVNLNHGSLYLTYPATIKNINFDLSKEDSQERINNLELLLKQEDIDIHCNAASFNLNRIFFFNTHYHLNKNGALIRSENLSNCLNRLIKSKNNKKLPFEVAITQTNILEKQYLQKQKNVMTFTEIRLKDLQKVKKALEKYYLEHGKYPHSVGFDGLYTKWGKSGKNWINGLSPKYIDCLPKDPRKTLEKHKQYIYKSDGKNYKIISLYPEDCQEVKEKFPKLIDPKRGCTAYGFWTDGASKW